MAAKDAQNPLQRRRKMTSSDQWAGPVKYNGGNFNVTVFAKPIEHHDAASQKRFHINKVRQAIEQ
jgi:hypothetical protein